MLSHTTRKDWTVYSYDHVRDGQIAVGTITSPWIPMDGVSELTVQGAFTGGTTVVTVEYSVDGQNIAASTATISISVDTPVKLSASWQWARVKIVQTVAGTSNARLAVKASD